MDNKTKKPHRIWRIVLVVSLALNIAVVGGVAGMAISGRTAGGPPQRIMLDFGPLSQVLEPADRRAIGQKLRKDGNRPFDRDEMREKIDAFANVLRREPFEAALIAQELGAFRARSDKFQQDVQTAFVAQLGAMTPEARAVLADKLDNWSRR